MDHTGVTNRNIHTDSGITLDDHHRFLVGLVLDLFQAKCTWQKLQHFTEDGLYLDAFADAKGRDQVGGQFFGLPFVTHVTKAHLVLSDSNSLITFRMIHTFHFAKAFLLGQSITFTTVVTVELQDGKIKKLTDRPEGDLPSDAVTKAMRNLNAFLGPKVLSLPTNAEEDEAWWTKHVAGRTEQEELEAAQGGPGGKPAVEETKRG